MISPEVVSLDEVLDLLGIEEGRNGRWACPMCPPASSEHKPAMTIDAANGIWYCHRCAKGGGILRLASLAWDCDFREAEERIREELGLPDAEADEGSALLRRIEKAEAAEEGEGREDIVEAIIAEAWIHDARSERYHGAKAWIILRSKARRYQWDISRTNAAIEILRRRPQEGPEAAKGEEEGWQETNAQDGLGMRQEGLPIVYPVSLQKRLASARRHWTLPKHQ